MEDEIKPSENQPAAEIPETADSGKTEEIKNPVAYAKAYREKADRLSAKLIETETALSEMQKKAQALEERQNAIAKSIKMQLAVGALQQAGIADSEVVSILSKEVAEKIELDDNFTAKDGSYIERAKALSAKMVVKTAVILPPPSAKVEEPVEKNWKKMFVKLVEQNKF